jgi:photosystem II stability/assembly factor-like uncharacterized protein
LPDQHVFAMAVDDRSESPVLYAGMLPPALYRSRDLGLTWQQLPSIGDVADAERWEFRAPPGAAHVKNIAFHPASSETLYVCIEQGGLLASTNAGGAWREIDSWIEPNDFFYRDSHRLVVSRQQPDVMYMATGDGLCKTSDAGRTWTRLTTAQDRVGYPDAVFLDPASDDVVYVGGAGGHPGTWNEATARPGVVRSSDGGKTWRACMGGLPDPLAGNIEAMSMVVSPAGVSLLIGTAVGEVWSSDDRAESWRLIAETAPISKAGHYRKFLSPDARALAERELARQRDEISARLTQVRVV